MTRQDPARFAASPRSLGYRMPAEYAPHKRTWMMWPTRTEVWDDIAATKRDYAAVAHAIREFEPVTLRAYGANNGLNDFWSVADVVWSGNNCTVAAANSTPQSKESNEFIISAI